MNFSAQTNAVCGNARCLRQWGGVGGFWVINDDTEQTRCMRRKAAWLLAACDDFRRPATRSLPLERLL